MTCQTFPSEPMIGLSYFLASLGIGIFLGQLFHRLSYGRMNARPKDRGEGR